MWKCKKCDGEVIGRINIESIANIKIDKQQNIIGQDIQIKKKEFQYHICNNCGNKSYFLEDIAEWVDD